VLHEMLSYHQISDADPLSYSTGHSDTHNRFNIEAVDQQSSCSGRGYFSYV
jgi:hypothetical protein